MALYRCWLQQVSPGAVPNFFGLFAWSAARLFVEKSIALGGKLDRATLIDALRKGDNWTGNGLHVPQHVGAQAAPATAGAFIQLNGGKWSPVAGNKYHAAADPIDVGLRTADMSSFIAYTIFGLFSGAAYAIAASGLVLTYTTTRVFNIAHGAFGMLLSFLFWDFSVQQGLPIWLSLILVLFVVAPAIGWFIQRFVARGLGDAPVSVSLVVTVGAARRLHRRGHAASTSRRPAAVLPFFPETSFTLGDDRRSPRHQLITILASVLVAVGLYLLLTRTRIGTAMRASVDNPELLKLFGGKPDQVASAVVDDRHLAGRPRRHPARLAGRPRHLLAHAAGHQRVRRGDARPAQEPAARRSSAPWASACSAPTRPATSTPTAPWARSRTSSRRCSCSSSSSRCRRPSCGSARSRASCRRRCRRCPRRSAGARPCSSLVALLAGSMSEANLLLVGTAATYAIVMLSLVLLTGYGGHVSLAQFTFAGVGALAYAKLDEPNLYGLLHLGADRGRGRGRWSRCRCCG